MSERWLGSLAPHLSRNETRRSNRDLQILEPVLRFCQRLDTARTVLSTDIQPLRQGTVTFQNSSQRRATRIFSISRAGTFSLGRNSADGRIGDRRVIGQIGRASCRERV